MISRRNKENVVSDISMIAAPVTAPVNPNLIGQFVHDPYKLSIADRVNMAAKGLVFIGVCAVAFWVEPRAALTILGAASGFTLAAWMFL